MFYGRLRVPVFHLASLWFDNCTIEFDTHIKPDFVTNLQKEIWLLKSCGQKLANTCNSFNDNCRIWWLKVEWCVLPLFYICMIRIPMAHPHQYGSTESKRRLLNIKQTTWNSIWWVFQTYYYELANSFTICYFHKVCCISATRLKLESLGPFLVCETHC